MPNPGERVRDVHVTDDTLAVDLIDGRTIIVPLAWYPRLLDATAEQRERWQLAGAGYGIHWPEIDEDLSTEGLLRGAPAAAEPARSQRLVMSKAEIRVESAEEFFARGRKHARLADEKRPIAKRRVVAFESVESLLSVLTASGFTYFAR